MGPIWKIFCFLNMGVDMPVEAVASILKEQEEWDKSRERKSSKENLHKR